MEMKALWDRFDSLGTEMIVTKLGRWVTLYPLVGRLVGLLVSKSPLQQLGYFADGSQD